MTGLVMSKLTMAESVSELIHGLVMQRYPELKFIAVEGQIGWISFFQYYSDHLWEKHRFWTKSELEEPPSHYFQRQVFGTFMEDPVGLREREHIGIDNIMWASDYPHSETTWPNSKALTDEWFTPLRRGGQGQDPLEELRQALQSDLMPEMTEVLRVRDGEAVAHVECERVPVVADARRAAGCASSRSTMRTTLAATRRWNASRGRRRGDVLGEELAHGVEQLARGRASVERRRRRDARPAAARRARPRHASGASSSIRSHSCSATRRPIAASSCERTAPERCARA